MDHENEAKLLARFYFRLACSNTKWDSDNNAEVDALVEHLILAAVQRMKRELDNEREDEVAARD